MTHSFCSENVLVDGSRWARRRNFSVLQAEFDAGRLFIDTSAALRDEPAALVAAAGRGGGLIGAGDETRGVCWVNACCAPRWGVGGDEPPVALAIEALTPSAKSLTGATPRSAPAPGPILTPPSSQPFSQRQTPRHAIVIGPGAGADLRSEEHTSELQSHLNLVCRLLLEKKKKTLR